MIMETNIYAKIVRTKMIQNKQVISITVQTNFKPIIDDGEDCKEEMIRRFHDAVYQVVEEMLVQNDEFEQLVMEEIETQDFWMPKGVNEFSDLGSISIKISEDSIEIHQRNMTDEEVEENEKKIHRTTIPKTQTRLININ